MNLKAEKEKIQNLNRASLSKYEANNLEMLKAANRKVQEAKNEKPKLEKGVSVPGSPDQRLFRWVLALSEEKKLKELNREIQKRKNQLLTPQEKAENNARRKAISKKLEMLKAN